MTCNPNTETKMSFTSVNKAIATVVMEAKLSVIDDLITFLNEKIDLDEDLKEIFDEFKTNLKESEEKVVKEAGKKTKSGKNSVDGTEKKKRAPSIFNLYIKDVMPDMKAKHPDVKDGKLMIGFASESWKTDPMAIFIKEKISDLKADNKDCNVVELYSKAKSLYKSSEESAFEPESEPEPASITKKSSGKKSK